MTEAEGEEILRRDGILPKSTEPLQAPTYPLGPDGPGYVSEPKRILTIIWEDEKREILTRLDRVETDIRTLATDVTSLVNWAKQLKREPTAFTENPLNLQAQAQQAQPQDVICKHCGKDIVEHHAGNLRCPTGSASFQSEFFQAKPLSEHPLYKP